jgi:hypothetical protein
MFCLYFEYRIVFCQHVNLLLIIIVGLSNYILVNGTTALFFRRSTTALLPLLYEATVTYLSSSTPNPHRATRRAAPPCGHSPTCRRHRRSSCERTPVPAPAAGPGRSRAGCRSPTPSARLRLRPPSPFLSSMATAWARPSRHQRRNPRRCAGTGARRW